LSSGYIPPVNVEILTIDVSIIRRMLMMIKVNKRIVDLFTNNGEPDFGLRPSFAFSDKLIGWIEVLMNLSSKEILYRQN